MTLYTENDQRNTSDVERSDVATIECLRAEVRRLRLELQQERNFKHAVQAVLNSYSAPLIQGEE